MTSTKTKLKKAEEEAISLHKEVYGDNQSAVNDQTTSNLNDENQDGSGNDDHDEGIDAESVTATAAFDDDDTQDDSDPLVQAERHKKRADDLESRLKVIKGKYDTEVPALHRQLKAMQEEIADLRISRTASPVGATGAASSDAVADTDEGAPSDDAKVVQAKTADALDEKRFEDYGEEIQDMVKSFNTLRSDVQAQLGEIKSAVAELRKGVNVVVKDKEVTTRKTFLSQISARFPDIGKWGDDPVVNDFLENTVDKVSGLPLAVLAGHHFKTGNVESYMAIMDKFVDANPTYRRVNDGETAESQTQQSTQKTSRLASMVVPDSGRSPKELAGKTNVKTISLEDFKASINDLTREKQRGNISQADYDKQFAILNRRLRGGSSK